MTHPVTVPAPLLDFHTSPTGRAWVASLPALAMSYVDRWSLRLDGAPRHGMVSLVLPVRRVDGTPAVLKLQPLDDETRGEPLGLRLWAGAGAVLLLDDDPATGTMLLERLDADRPLSALPDDIAAVQILAELGARLVAWPAPPGLRHLRDIAAGMLADVPGALPALPDADDRRMVERWAAAVAEVLGEAGDRLLHWDLHYDNVLAGAREAWLAIDPKPLAGDPGFELLPALHNRWDDIVATGDVARAVRRRFDLMVDVLALERERAVAWTMGRLLQNALWQIEDGDQALDPAQVAIYHALIDR